MIKLLVLGAQIPGRPAGEEVTPEDLLKYGNQAMFLSLQEIAKIERAINMLIEEHNALILQIEAAGVVPLSSAILSTHRDPNQIKEPS